MVVLVAVSCIRFGSNLQSLRSVGSCSDSTITHPVQNTRKGDINVLDINNDFTNLLSSITVVEIGGIIDGDIRTILSVCISW